MVTQARDILDRIKRIPNYSIPDVDEFKQTSKNTSFFEAFNIVCDPANLLNGQPDDTQVQWAVHHPQAFIQSIPTTIEDKPTEKANNFASPTAEASMQEILTYANQSPKPDDQTQSNTSQPIIQPNKPGPVQIPTFCPPADLPTFAKYFEIHKLNISPGTTSLFWSLPFSLWTKLIAMMSLFYT